MKPQKYISKRAAQLAASGVGSGGPGSGVATIQHREDDAQVKTLTYLDNNGSNRTQHTHYNKVSSFRIHCMTVENVEVFTNLHLKILFNEK